MKTLDIKDLKIGSLVSYNNCDLKVTALGSRSDIIGLERHPLTAFNRVSPIPLSEEWLLKLGFNFNGFDFVNQLITVIIKGEFFKIWVGSFFIKEIKSVHQLQNIYYTLTGKDL